jgi:hypothetical protein
VGGTAPTKGGGSIFKAPLFKGGLGGSSLFRAQSSIVRAQSSIVRARSSIVRAQSSIVRAQSSIVRVQSSIVRARSSIVRARSSIVRARSSIVRARSSIVRAQSSIGMCQRAGGVLQAMVQARVPVPVVILWPGGTVFRGWERCRWGICEGVRPFRCSIEEGEALANEDIEWCPKACPANASPLHKIRCRRSDVGIQVRRQKNFPPAGVSCA